jgi:hypothetical protein
VVGDTCDQHSPGRQIAERRSRFRHLSDSTVATLILSLVCWVAVTHAVVYVRTRSRANSGTQI